MANHSEYCRALKLAATSAPASKAHRRKKVPCPKRKAAEPVYTAESLPLEDALAMAYARAKCRAVDTEDGKKLVPDLSRLAGQQIYTCSYCDPEQKVARQEAIGHIYKHHYNHQQFNPLYYPDMGQWAAEETERAKRHKAFCDTALAVAADEATVIPQESSSDTEPSTAS